LPILLAGQVNLYVVSFLPVITLATYLAMGPGAYMLIMQNMYGKSWKSKIKIMPALLIYNAGMSVNNTVAVFDAVLGKKNEFLRTPKYGIVSKEDDWKDKAYNLPFTQTTLLEIFFGVYGIMGIFIAIFSNNPIFVPIIALQTIGFFFIAYLSLSHTRFKKNKSKNDKPLTKKEKTANNVYKLAMLGILAIIVFGGYTAISGYHAEIYPLDRIRGNLDGIIGSSDPNVIHDHLVAIQTDLDLVMVNLPETMDANGNLIAKNPVWIFSTESTNFLRIQNNIDTMITSVNEISSISKDNSAYHTGMLDITDRSTSLKINIMDATQYMYISPANMMMSVIWVAAIIGIFTVLKRKRTQLKKVDSSNDIALETI